MTDFDPNRSLDGHLTDSAKTLANAGQVVAHAIAEYARAYEAHMALHAAHAGLARQRAQNLGIEPEVGDGFAGEAEALVAQLVRAKSMDLVDFVVASASIDRNRALLEGETDPVYAVLTSPTSPPHATLGLTSIIASAASARANVAGGGHG